MESFSERNAILTTVVIKHLPATNVQLRPESFKTRAEWHANSLRIAYRDATETFQVSHDKDSLAKIHYHLSVATRLAEELTEETRTDLGRFSIGERERKWVLVHGSFEKQIRALRSRASAVRNRLNLRGSASGKRNWQAMSLAYECRLIWGTEIWLLRNPGFEYLVDKVPYEQAISLAPKTQNHYRPAAFGCFLEDVLESLGLEAKDGGRMSAASALDSLNDFLGQEEGQPKVSPPDHP